MYKKLSEWGKKKSHIKGLVTLEKDPGFYDRPPSPVNMKESELRAGFNKDLWHNIPVVVTKTIQQIIDAMDKNSFEIQTNLKSNIVQANSL